jgi:broad specificity phosphatase PhoE
LPPPDLILEPSDQSLSAQEFGFIRSRSNSASPPRTVSERKARDGTQILADTLGLEGYSVVDDLGENDRSATGYLAKEEFEATADAFFAHPQESVRGWEPAVIAEARIICAVEQIGSQTSDDGDLAIVGHGGTGTLLYCHLAGLPIDRCYDQPATNGGNWFAFDRTSRKLLHDGWRSIDLPVGEGA